MLDALLLLAFACLGLAGLAIAVEGCLELSDRAAELDVEAGPVPAERCRAGHGEHAREGAPFAPERSAA